MKRNFKMYCVDVDKDGSEFEIIFEMNNEIVEKETVYSFDDVLFTSFSFFKMVCKKYDFDGRRDTLEVNIDYKF